MRRALLALLTLVLTIGLMVPLSAGQSKNFRAHLTGSEEVPAIETQGQGQVIFKVVGNQVQYRLITANLEAITQAHIHCGAAGTNGPPEVFLFHLVPEGVDSTGVLSSGTFGADDLLGNCGYETLADLLEAMVAGDTYVNVHTVDFPTGEIRGQIR